MKSTCKYKIAVMLFVALMIAAPGCIEAKQTSPADEHTIALWLFDDTLYPNCILTDAGPYEHDLRLVSGYAKWWMKIGGEISILQDGTHGSDTESALITSGARADVPPLHPTGRHGLVKGKFGGGLRLPLGEKGEIIWPDNRQRYASEFLRDRDAYVPERLNIGYLDWTIEFWYKAAGKLESRASVFELRNELHPRTTHMVNALMFDSERKQFVLLSRIFEDDPSQKYHLELAIPSDDERLNSGDWHHYAFTYTASERQLRHYVDGKLQPLPDKGGFLPMMSKITRVTIDSNLQGILDEMRISDMVRYSGDFPLPGTFSRNYAARPREANKPNGPPLLFGPENLTKAPLHLMSRKHVFIDDALIEHMENVVLTANPPQSYEVTNFKNTRPWEPTPRFGSTIPDICSFWDEGNEIRMLYTNGGMWGGKSHAVCYATSTDGINWDKPVLDLKNWGGSTKNNIVLLNACQGSVIKDPNPAADPEERYKYAAWHMYWGYYVYTSADGIRWRRNETCSLPIDPDGSTSFYWDDQRGVYRGYVRALFDMGYRRRTAQITMPEFLKPWPFKRVEFPDLGDMVLARPVSGELPLIDTGGQVYRFKAHNYAWAPDVYLAFPWRYIADGNIRPGSFLMVSRDGVNWKRYEPPYYFAPGGEMDGHEVTEALTEHGMIRRGNEIWQFGTVRFTVHGGVLYGGEEREGGIHDRLLMLKQRLDGFVSLDASTTTGTVVTKPLIFEGDKLVLNISAEGSARVGILDKDGRVVSGFAIEDCDPISTDSVRHIVTWQDKSDVSRAAGKVIKLKLELKKANLYALQFVTGR